MIIQSSNKKNYLVEKMPSIFTNRQGKNDCYISKEVSGMTSLGGRRDADGRVWNCIARLASESGEFIRQYEQLPTEITQDFLRENGFID